ncbi:energy transducer TonB [Luminiphilus sp.]|nr:energy transducer TonB [Luminiphilus sp.]MDB3918905.1 energy transducer TonB [Luminiphilus sp.]
MHSEYGVLGNMPLATSVSVVLHTAVAVVLSTTLIGAALSQKSTAATVILTPSQQAPTDTQHIASDNQLSRPGELASTFSEKQAAATLALIQSEPVDTSDASTLAAEVERLQGELSQMQQDQAKSTRLGSVAARRALDANYLRQWVNRVEQFGNAALNSVGNVRGDVRLLTVVDKFGILLNVQVLDSSGFPHLDRAAVKTVQDAAPYPAFPPALSAQVDKLEIVRTWQFRP